MTMSYAEARAGLAAYVQRLEGENAALRAALVPSNADRAPKTGEKILAEILDRHGNLERYQVCWWQEEFGAFISGCRAMCLHNGYTFEDGSTQRLHSPEIVTFYRWIRLPLLSGVP